MQQSSAGNGQWTFLTNHAHVLLSVANDPELRLRDIADVVGITERPAQRIISSLVADGYLVRHRVGRRSHYPVKTDLPLRHAIESHHRRAGPGRDAALGRSVRRWGGIPVTVRMTVQAALGSNRVPLDGPIRI